MPFGTADLNREHLRHLRLRKYALPAVSLPLSTRKDILNHPISRGDSTEYLKLVVSKVFLSVIRMRRAGAYA